MDRRRRSAIGNFSTDTGAARPAMIRCQAEEHEYLAPFLPTPQEVVDRMLDMANVTSNDVVYDLGSGDGRILITAAARYGVRGVGFEIDPPLVTHSRRRI